MLALAQVAEDQDKRYRDVYRRADALEAEKANRDAIIQTATAEVNLKYKQMADLFSEENSNLAVLSVDIGNKLDQVLGKRADGYMMAEVISCSDPSKTLVRSLGTTSYSTILNCDVEHPRGSFVEIAPSEDGVQVYRNLAPGALENKLRALALALESIKADLEARRALNIQRI